MSEKRFSSSEMQKMFRITRPTLRYYMDKGLLHGEKDDMNGQISFGFDDLDDMVDILYLRQNLDFSTKEIEAYMRSGSFSDQASIYFMHKEMLKREIEKRKKQLEILAAIEDDLQILMKMENDIRAFSSKTPFYVLTFSDTSGDIIPDSMPNEDLFWFCNVFKACDDAPCRYRYVNSGYWVERLDDSKLEYDDRKYTLNYLPPGDYLYGVSSVSGDYRDPAILKPFLDYAEEHGLKLGDTVVSAICLINRKEEERIYSYDVLIPIIK